MTNFLKYALLLVSFTGLVACDKNDGNGSTTAETKLALDRTNVLVEPGKTATVIATVTPQSLEDRLVWSSDNEDVATVENGIITGVAIGDATVRAILKDEDAGIDLREVCHVYVVENPIESIALDKSAISISEKESATLTAITIPADVEGVTVEWSADDASIVTITPDEDGTYCHIAAAGIGKTTVTALAYGGLFSASCEITVTQWEAPSTEPKVGDYFYSDGTWSDGGLISIEADGTNPVWAETKPAPISGKTVIGIVFQTNPDRIAQTEKDKGFTHGYVVATKKAHSTDYSLTSYCLSGDFECLTAKKAASSWYKNIDGYTETQTVLSAYTGEDLKNCPLFDWVNEFGNIAPAPANTSGWFVPATGQVWDMVANFGGGEAAEYLASQQTATYDATYYVEKKDISYSLIDAFNEKMSLVPADQKEEFEITDAVKGSSYRELSAIWTSSYYGDDMADIFCIGKGNKVGKTSAISIMPSCAYMTSREAYACPILAF